MEVDVWLGAIPAVILVALRFYLPESPRWLLIQGREEDAKKALAKLGGYTLVNT